MENTKESYYKPYSFITDKKYVSPHEIKAEILSRLSSLYSRNGKYFSDCPYCGKPAKKEKFSYNPDKISRSKHGVFNCFSCGSKGNGFELYLFLSGKIPAAELRPISSIPKKKIVKKPFPGIPTYIYFHPLTQKIAYGVNREETKDGKTFKQLHVKNGYWYYGLNKRKRDFLFNLNLVSTSKGNSVLIFEGEKKCLYAQSFTNYQCLSYPGGSNYRITKKDIKYLAGKKVYIFPDYDRKNEKANSMAGQKAAYENYLIFKSAGIDCEIVHFIESIEINAEDSGYDFEDFLKSLPTDLDRIEKLGSLLLNTNSYKFSEYFRDPLIEINQKYISDMNINAIDSKLIFIQSQQGSGKTRLIEKLIEKKLIDANRFIYICSRSELARENARNFNITAYTDLPKFYTTKHTDSFTTCINSLYKFTAAKDAEYDAIFIDEVFLLVNDLLTSKTDGLNGFDRLKAISTLKQFLKNAKKIVCLDADLKEETISFLEYITGLKPVIVKNNFTDSRKYKCYGNEEMIVDAIYKNIGSGKNKTSISCVSSTYAKDLKTQILSKFPGHKLLLVTQEESTKKNVKDFLYDPKNESKKYDTIIYSSVIGTGTDFNFDYSSNHFHICRDNKTLTHFQQKQMVCRFRKADTIHFFIKQIEGEQEINPDGIKMDEMIKDEFTYFDRDLNQGVNSDLLDFYCRIKARENHSKNNLKQNFIDYITSCGAKISYVKNVSTEKEEEDLKEESRKARNLNEEIRINSTINAKNITQKEAEAIKKNGSSNDAEYYELEKYKYLNIIKDENLLQRAAKIKIDRLERIQGRILDMNTPYEVLREIDKRKYTGFLPDNAHREKKARLRNEIERILGGLSGKVVTESAEFINFIAEHQEEIRLFLKLKVNLERPGYFIRSFYESIGIEKDILKKSDSLRQYVLSQESINLYNSIKRADERIIYKENINLPDEENLLFTKAA